MSTSIKSSQNKAYYQANRDRIIAQKRLYKQTEKGRLVSLASSHRRRALQKASTSEERLLTTPQVSAMYDEATHCPYCGKKLSEGQIHLDHFVPLARGGEHSKENTLLCCQECNLSKSDRNPFEWMAEKGVEFRFMV